MRIGFHLVDAEYNQFTVVIILNVANCVVRLVADGVSDVITLKVDRIKAAPNSVPPSIPSTVWSWYLAVA